jgi:hypothetical protein
MSSSLSITEDGVASNENRPKIGAFCTFHPLLLQNLGEHGASARADDSG